MKITFEKLTDKHIQAVFSWLEDPEVKEFWDNSQAHKDDIAHFVAGRVGEPSAYFGGLYTYWVGLYDGQPYSLLMTVQEKPGHERSAIKEAHLSLTGTTYSIDYMIGDACYRGRGLGALTLELFLDFFKQNSDVLADTFFIDPTCNNPRAKHVYEKAGFVCVGEFVMGGNGVFTGDKAWFLVKKV